MRLRVLAEPVKKLHGAATAEQLAELIASSPWTAASEMLAGRETLTLQQAEILMERLEDDTALLKAWVASFVVSCIAEACCTAAPKCDNVTPIC